MNAWTNGLDECIYASVVFPRWQHPAVHWDFTVVNISKANMILCFALLVCVLVYSSCSRAQSHRALTLHASVDACHVSVSFCRSSTALLSVQWLPCPQLSLHLH